MTVYLVDESSFALAKSFASKDSDAHLVLLEDAVYHATTERNGQLYAITDDVERRGLRSKLQPSIVLISYDQMVEMMERERVVNLL
ncbi:MAG: hypothetical protein JRN15_02180 [Nitrososphaerota archaeon]|jgi:sulfur relay protein TusB/DsrH|nr:hypothetical protein [Nitrososphaerota archaeon]